MNNFCVLTIPLVCVSDALSPASRQSSPCTKQSRIIRCRTHGSNQVRQYPLLPSHPNSSLIFPTRFNRFRGPTSAAFLEWLTPSCLASLSPYSSTLSVLLNEKGGIIDDTVITKHSEDAFYVVTNAGRRDRDLSWFAQKVEEWNSDSQKSERGKVEMQVLEGWGLLALQGPEAAKYLQTLTSFDLRSLTFGRSAFVPLEGFNLHVARGGYTGEDGFEVFLSPPPTRL